MKLRIGLAATLALVAVLTVGPATSSSAPGDNAIVHWSEIAEAAISAPAVPGGPLRPPASSTVLAGMVHGAMYDAVASVVGGLEPFATRVSAPPEASADAAVAQAARDVLVTRVPGQAATVQAAYDAYMAAIPAGAAKDGGKAVGAAAAAGMLAWRTGDHFDDVVPYVQPTPGPGVFEPIAAGVINPIPPPTPVDVKLGKVRPFTYATPAYRPDPPYALTSLRYARDVAELKEIGRATSTSRTAAQTQTVRFFTDPTYLQYSRGLRGFVNEQGLDLRESARLLGYAWVTVADTMIACWEAKYYYMFWRPNHAIQRADTDRNPFTSPDPTWLPLVTGNHPEYPSGHACFTAGVATSLQKYFGTKHVPFTLSSVVTGTTRTYQRLDDLVEDVENARVWGGLHYRTTMTETAKHFPRVARDVGKRYFLAAPAGHEDED
jgi:hypothetical protein